MAKAAGAATVAEGAAGGADAAGADGGYGLPMTGGAGNRREESERHRDAWMDEDAELWDGGTQAVPSVIGR